MSDPLVVEIKANSLDDGPGIRSVVFFKGCPLSCTWCHNPESQCVANELMFDQSKCVASQRCYSACDAQALSPDNPQFVNREACTLCMKCVEACPSGALLPAANTRKGVGDKCE